jgi:hypothetical protein
MTGAHVGAVERVDCADRGEGAEIAIEVAAARD